MAQVALQMYTLRGLTKEDYAGTVQKVAEMGYPAIQVSGFGNSNPKEIRKMMDDLELGSAGTHLGLGMMERDVDEVIDIVKTLRAGYAVVPGLPEDRRQTADDWKRLGELFTEIAEKMAAEDVGLAYHNHAFEFETFDGKLGYDILFEAAGDVVETEIDTYWVQYGGQDAVAYLKKFPGRETIVHFKDMSDPEERRMVPVGEGVLDWPAIIEACKEGGTEYYCIEQDNCDPLEPLEAARVSLENCREWGLV